MPYNGEMKNNEDIIYYIISDKSQTTVYCKKPKIKMKLQDYNAIIKLQPQQCAKNK